MNPHSVSTYRSARWRRPSWWLLILTAATLPLFILGWALLLGSQPAKASPLTQTGWQLVWSDEFNGTSVDTTKWHVWNAHSNINSEPEYYTPNNVSESGGNLVIVTKNNDFIPGATEGYTSGRLETYCGYAPDGCTPAG